MRGTSFQVLARGCFNIDSNKLNFSSFELLILDEVDQYAFIISAQRFRRIFLIIRNQRVPFIECRVFSPRHFSAFIHTKYRARRKLSISAGDLLFLEILLFSHYRNFLSAGLVELLLPGEHLARYNTAESVARRYTHSNEGNIRNRAWDDDDVGNAELLLCGLPGAYPEHE